MTALLAFTLLASSTLSVAQPARGVDASALRATAPDGARLREEGLRRSQAHALATDLTDRIGARLSGSPALDQANRWAMARLRAIGASNVHLEDCGAFGSAWQSGGAKLEMTTPTRSVLIAEPTPWSVASRGPVTASAVSVVVPDEAALARYRGKLRGRIVLLGEPPKLTVPFEGIATRFSDAELRTGSALEPIRTYYAHRPERLARLAKRTRLARVIGRFLEGEGVRGLVLPSKAAIGGLLTTDDSDIPGGRVWRADERINIPVVRVAAEGFNRMSRLLAQEVPVALTLDVRATTGDGRKHVYTVVADLPGTDPALAGQYVLLGAHLDSWAGGTGATDNGAGVAIALEAMRLVKALPPSRRTVRVVLYGGEEQGLLCSGAYADAHVGRIPRSQAQDQLDIGVAQWSQPTGPLARGPDYDLIAAAFNVDNGAGRVRGVLTGGRNPGLAAILRGWLPALADLGIDYVYDEPDWPADQVSFTELGIPGMTFMQDPLDYNARTHHTNLDTADRLIPEDLAQASTVLAALVTLTANAPTVAPRVAPNDAR